MTQPSTSDRPPPFPRLFSPLRVGPARMRNRVVVGPHFTMFSEPAETFGEPGLYGARYGRYLAERAAGGAGMIIAGQAHVHPSTAYQMRNNASAWDGAAPEQFRDVTRPIHDSGALVILQLAHNGAKASSDWWRRPLLAPSSTMLGHEAPKVMDDDDIAEIVEHFARSARNAIAGGFDGVEIHGAHHYLIHQFLSPVTNRRDDRYGGSPENRMRFAIEVLEAVRAAVGSDKIVGLRLPGDEYGPDGGGISADDAAQIASRLEELGLVDFLDVSVGGFSPMVQPMYAPHLLGVYAARAVKQAVSRTPVFAVHRILTPDEAESVIAREHADAVVLVRAVIADPEWPVKARDGRPDEIRPCVGCNQLCFGNLFKALPIECVTNPAVGRETQLGSGTLVRATRSKRVVVVGGGPGGMEAAWVAAARGHDVVLLERALALGGKLPLASSLPGRGEIAGWFTWRAEECRRQGVDVRLGTDADAPAVLALQPDAVVIATGGRAVTHTWTAAYQAPFVGDDTTTILDHEQAIAEPANMPDEVVVFDVVGHVEGAALTELLASTGRHVTLVTPGWGLPQLDHVTSGIMLKRAVQAGARWRPGCIVTGVRHGRAVITDSLAGTDDHVPAGAVVVRCAGEPLGDGLHRELAKVVRDVIRVGDALACRTADRAIFEGHLAGRAI